MRNNASHVSLAQASVTDHCIACPYEDKVVPNGTTARMVLMFLRDIVEPQPRKTYACPMMHCHKAFAGPMPLIQHLLSCPELSNGVFGCDKCGNWHGFPTNEKEWAQWTGWKNQQPVQRKRSLGSKMRDTFALRRKDPARKANQSPEPQFDHSFSNGARLGTSGSENQRGLTAGCVEHHHHMPLTSHRHIPDFLNLEKTPTVTVEVDRGMFWPGLSAEQMTELHSAVSSIAPSSTFEASPSQSTSTNTSTTTLFAQRFGSYQSPTPSSQGGNSIMTPRQYMFSPQPTFGTGSLSEHRRSSSAMSLDEPLSVSEHTLSPSELPPTSPDNNHSWWSMKPATLTQRLVTPVSSVQDTCFHHIQAVVPEIMHSGVTGELTAPTSPAQQHSSPESFYPMDQASTHMSMSRALSQESMPGAVTSLYGSFTDGHQLEAQSPYAGHSHHGIAIHRKAALESPTEELICDECQWKPRGVRENLKGYLRKHKNTHKGLRLSCDEDGCAKTFSRLDNLKKHRKDKHGIDDPVSVLPSKRVAEDYSEHIENDADAKRPDTSDSRIRGVPPEDYSMLWPALHF
ncbi:hypothetical protein B0T17DRAFT_614398 [Bombardia bombarda]|uniref:C2H2-type domain-containing protein n=1 Tax=Bombardia bombarda TaxID=252184 RepID=A0AA40C7K1_9PEZI|nr:hypothetical protein B0T17DRAFT_614398 [Bombardia bombarda]